MTGKIISTLRSLIAHADAEGDRCERLATLPRSARHLRVEAEEWRRHADRLRAIADRHNLSIDGVHPFLTRADHFHLRPPLNHRSLTTNKSAGVPI
jgi:hypothetical protein